MFLIFFLLFLMHLKNSKEINKCANFLGLFLLVLKLLLCVQRSLFLLDTYLGFLNNE